MKDNKISRFDLGVASFIAMWPDGVFMQLPQYTISLYCKALKIQLSSRDTLYKLKLMF